MAGWILVPCLVSLRNEFNQLAPNRDKGSDGSIGDTSHSASSSDHNPDETGNTPSEDADSKNEVHAIDVDADLRKTDWSMARAVNVIRLRHKDGKDDRLQNIIWNRRIASRSWGWTWRDYTGSNPHDKHAHFSARYTTAQENDTRPWGLLEDDMPTVDEIADEVVKRLAPLMSTDAGVNPIAKIQIPDYAQPEKSRRKLPLATWIGYTDANRNTDKAALIKAIAALPQVDAAKLAAALAPLLAEAVVGALPEDRDDVTTAELQDAIVGALKVLVERPPA